jgi:hypothetical protein
VVQLQTLHDFPRWKKEGKLLAYKPAGFSRVYSGFKDPDCPPLTSRPRPMAGPCGPMSPPPAVLPQSGRTPTPT